ncbi:SurA N-terminal domain-containing protein [Streptomyces sp. RKAG293]|uniref:SurA N-terminal domain-containing protein n=1 Tax=Streptomyces sp. RKAG293 TaxID=2893403 RepID=UPI0020337E68|nr:SurA N-terminal domain-containing protein [Streptomyces sp. RKAG293]MCM2419759.1 SurA N-terminal domain-containing protein [Streptomyces sp. RKAG293]
MVRRRTAVSLAAAALVAMTPVISACGTPHAGAAAVVENETISVSDLQSQVNAVRTAQEKSPQSAALLEGTSKLSQMTLSRLVATRVLDRIAKDAGITVTRSETEQMRKALESRYGGADGFLQTFGVAPSGADAFSRLQVEAAKIIVGLRLEPGSDGGNTALSQLIAKTAKTMKIDVNPRYGTWDARTGQLGDTKEPWLVPVAEAPVQGA